MHTDGSHGPEHLKAPSLTVLLPPPAPEVGEESKLGEQRGREWGRAAGKDGTDGAILPQGLNAASLISFVGPSCSSASSQAEGEQI